MTAFVLSVALAAAASQRIEISCPESVRVIERLESTHKEWVSSSFGNEPKLIEGATFSGFFYRDHAGTLEIIPPNEADKRPEETWNSTAKYVFSPTDAVFAVCSYGDHHAILLRRLPQAHLECVVETTDGKDRVECVSA